MDLEEGDPEGELRRLKDYCRKFRPPRLLLPKLQDTAMSTLVEVAGPELSPSSELGIVKYLFLYPTSNPGTWHSKTSQSALTRNQAEQE